MAKPSRKLKLPQIPHVIGLDSSEPCLPGGRWHLKWNHRSLGSSKENLSTDLAEQLACHLSPDFWAWCPGNKLNFFFQDCAHPTREVILYSLQSICSARENEKSPRILHSDSKLPKAEHRRHHHMAEGGVLRASSPAWTLGTWGTVRCTE